MYMTKLHKCEYQINCILYTHNTHTQQRKKGKNLLRPKLKRSEKGRSKWAKESGRRNHIYIYYFCVSCFCLVYSIFLFFVKLLILLVLFVVCARVARNRRKTEKPKETAFYSRLFPSLSVCIHCCLCLLPLSLTVCLEFI